MRYTLVATFESGDGLHVEIRKFWRLSAALRMRWTLESWHNVGNGSSVVCCVGIIGPNGGWV